MSDFHYEPKESDKVPFRPKSVFCTDIDTGEQHICFKMLDGKIAIGSYKMKYQPNGVLKRSTVPDVNYVTVPEFNEKYEVVVPEEEEPES